MTGVARHVPPLALEWQREHPGRRWQAVDGTLCFADISGFTALAERLARQGRVGGEELIETLGRVFGAMLESARARDGMLLKFGGDALLFLFRGEGHALRAAATAVEIRAALRRAAEVPTSVGRLRLSMSVGLHAGAIDFFLVGAPHRELVVTGPAVTAVVQAENAAGAGEIALSPAMAAQLPPGAARDRGDGTLLLAWRTVPARLPPGQHARPGAPVDDGLARRLFPALLCDALAGGAPEPEHRVACIAFGRFASTDALLAQAGPEAVADALDRTLATAQAAFAAEGVALLAVDIDRDGGKLFVGAGVPRATEDDEALMLRALRRIVEAGTPLPLQWGVQRGHVFVAEVGTAWRAAYSAMGDTTNTAARICAKAPPGAIYAHPAVLDNSLTLFETEPAGPFTFKGKAAAQVVYRVGEETGTRAREGRERLPLVGRDAELAALRGRVARAVAGTGAVVVVEGPIGIGRTRLAREAVADAPGATVIALRAEPSGASSPYRVFRDTVRAALGIERGSAAAMAAALESGLRRLDPALAPWAALVGDVAQVGVEPSAEVAALEPRFRPERTADVLIALLEALAPGPVVFVMDDAQWADEASGQLLARIARESAARPWLLVVTRRPGGGGFVPDGAERIELAPLTGEAALALVRTATEAAPMRPHEMQAIVARAGGNPLFIEEIVFAAREAGSVAALPSSLEAAIAAQLDALDEAARRIVRYAAVLGASFRTSVLEGLLQAGGGALDRDALAQALARADAFLEPAGEDHLAFRRGLVRDMAYEGLAFRVRRQLHQLAGEATEAAGGDVDAAADILAWHFSLAGDPARTWRYARISAQRAHRAYANPEAARLWRLALDAVRRLPGVPVAERVAAWTALGDACVNAGMFDDALAAYRAGSRLVRGDALAGAELAWMRANARERAGAFPAALREIAAGRRLLAGRADAAASRARAKLAALSAMVRFARQQFARAIAEAEVAITEARAAGEQAALAEALVAADSAQLSLGRGSSGRMREALAIYEALGDLPRVGMVRGNLGVEAYMAGRWDEALAWFEGDREIRERSGYTVGAATANANIGEILVKRGRHAEGEALLREAVRVMRASGYNDGAAFHELQLARGLLGRGALAEAGAVLARITREFVIYGQAGNSVEAAVVTALLRTREGRPAAALEVLRQAESTWRDALPVYAPQVAEARARALAAGGNVEAALGEVVTGLDAARELGFVYEEAMLRLAGLEIALAAGRFVAPADLDATVRALGGLGVALPRPGPPAGSVGAATSG